MAWTIDCGDSFTRGSFLQAESIQRREELLRDMEMASQETAKETYVREKERAQRQEELEQQVRVTDILAPPHIVLRGNCVCC